MEKNNFLLILVLCIFSTCISFAQPTPIVTTNILPNPINTLPGSDGYISINLRNTGNDYAQNIKIQIIGFDSGIEINKDDFNLGSLAPGDSTTLLIKYFVPTLTPSGLYKVKIKIEYCHQFTCKETYQYALINVYNPPIIKVGLVSPSSLKVGEKATLYLTLSNRGLSDAYNILVSIYDPSNSIFIIDSDNKQYIQKMSPKEEKIISMNISTTSSVTPGSYPILVRFEYSDATNSKYITNSTFGIKVAENVDFFVSVQEISGNLLTLTVGNIGLTTAYSVSIEVPPQKNLYSLERSAFIGNINPGDYTSVSFNLHPIDNTFNKTSDFNENNLILNIYYTNENGERVKVEKQIDINLFNLLREESTATSKIYQKNQKSFFQKYINYIIGLVLIILVFVFLKIGKKGRKK